MKTKKLLSFMLAIVMAVSMMTTLGISASAETAANSTTFDMKVNRNRVCSCSGGKVQDFCPDCNPLTQSSCTTCGGSGLAEIDCTECGGKGVKSWTDTISVTVTGEIKVGSTLTAVNNTASVPVTFTFDNGSASEIANPYTVQASDVGKTLTLCCEADSDKWDNLDNAVILGTVGANNDCWLDLDENTTDILEKKELEQNYNLTVNESISAENEVATKVKLSWEISDINAARTDNMVWDTTELKWVAASSSTTVTDKGTAKFTLENYSSVKVDATASFKAENGFNGTASYDAANGKVTLDTANGNDTYSKNNVPKAVIKATITTAADDFKNLAATTKATKYGTYTVTIGKYVETESIVLSNNTLDLNTNTNNTATLTATVSPANATDSKVTWSSDNTAVATVDENGKVTAVGAGTATITATVGAKSTTCTVNVVAKISVTNVSLNTTKLTLTGNDQSKKTATLIATVTPDNATNKNVTWSSSNTGVATVDANGNVTADDYATGTAVITATADNVSATCTVTVNRVPE